MSSPIGVIAGFGVAVSLLAGAPSLQSPAQTPAGGTDGVSSAARVSRFSGVWEYNAEESVNAYTGRPEQAPANARTSGRGTSGTSGGARRPPSGGAGAPGGGVMPPGGGMGGVGSGAGSGGSSWGGGDDWNAGYRGWAAAWGRSAQRDLLEVPWTYTIDATPESVTFVDDLKRSRTYKADGRKAKHQLGSAVFNARTTWDGDRLKKVIDAAGQFKMTETYFLSEDGNRLFVIIRLGDPEKAKKDTPPAGVNRVYDRVQ